MKKSLLCIFCPLFFWSALEAQDFASWNNNSLTLSNGVIEVLKWIRRKLKSKDFSLFIKGKYCDGKSGWSRNSISKRNCPR